MWKRSLEGINRRISDDLRMDFDKNFSVEEVKRAVFEMGAWKAPGPDGFRVGFYQENWALVGGDDTEVCLCILNGQNSNQDLNSTDVTLLCILNGPNSIQDLNSTNVTLIPKKKGPRKVSGYRPISLCNVVYKIVTKVLAIPLKCHLPVFISDEQSTFVLGHLITDNITIAFGTIHTIRKKTSGKNGVMALKQDMCKA